MRGPVGLVIGLIIGAGAMYLVLRPPWAGHATSPIDAGVIASAPSDAGAKPPKKKRPRRAGSPTQPGQSGQPGDELEETEPAPLTEADRRLEWRGDDVTLPAQRIDMGGAESRPLDDGEIQTTINGQASGVKDCVVQGATGTDLRATITVKMIVDGTGRVTKHKIQAPHYMLEHGLFTCTQRAVGRMKFPSTGAPTLVTLPVNLT